jgi:peptide/nickel transport system substrate-binding protein
VFTGFPFEEDNMRISTRWLIRATLLAALLVLVSIGVFSVGAQSGTLRVGVVTPAVLDPAQGSNDSEVLFNRSLYDYLVETLPDKSIAPNLATEWSISEDGLTYTFTLASGVTFHDGSAFSSADVVFTFNRLKEIESPAINVLGAFEASAPDASTVVFTLAAPNADFLYGVANRFALILKDGNATPNQIVEGDNPYVNFNGTGPFILTNYDSANGRAVLSRNPNYWIAGQPGLETLEFVFIDDPTTQVQALRGGQLDFIYKVTADQIASLEGESGISVITQATNQHPVIRLRADSGPGADPNVRQALKMATDRAFLNDVANSGQGVVGNNDPIGPGFGAFYDSTLAQPTYDPAAACALLSEAGYPDGLNLTLYVPIALGYDTLLGPALKETWAAGCINVEIQAVPEGSYYDDNFPNNWLAAELGITPWSDQASPQGYLVQAYSSGGVWNETRWSDPELDELIAQAGAAADPAARTPIYHQIAAVFADRGPIIVPWFASINGAVRSNVSGLVMAPFPGLTDFRPVSISS